MNKQCIEILIHGARGGIRTRGLPLRRRSLYPAELQAQDN